MGIIIIVFIIVVILTIYGAILNSKEAKGISQYGGIPHIPSCNVDFDTLDGYAFERFCATLLKNNGFTDVKVTPKKGDHGIDILARNGEKHYAIQCKRYSKNVGNKAIQEVYSGKTIYGVDTAVVLTNRYFTEQARNDAQKLGVQLWDRHVLLKLIRSEKTENMPQNHQLDDNINLISRKNTPTSINTHKTLHEFSNKIIEYQEKTHSTSPRAWKIYGTIMKSLAVIAALLGILCVFAGLFLLLLFTIIVAYIAWKLGSDWTNRGKELDAEQAKSRITTR